MYALNAITGKEIWKYTTPLALFGPPITYDNKLYFGGGDSKFYCLDLNGNKIWDFKTSLSYPVSIDLSNQPRKKSAEVVWTLPKRKEEDRYKSGNIEIADYGTFSGSYIDVSKTDYMGETKKGYLKKKDI